MEEISHAQVVDGYADALLAVARAEGAVDRVANELYQIAEAFSQSEELKGTLSDPLVPADRKTGVISDLLGSRASQTTVSLVEMLVATGRVRDFSEIAARVGELAAAAEKQVVAEVRSAIELDEATIERLAEKLSSATGKSVAVRVVVDPSVMGGIVARVGDTVFDGSVRSRLRKLREAWG